MNTLSNDQMNQVSGGALVTLFKAVIKGAGYVGTAITVSYNSYKAHRCAGIGMKHFWSQCRSFIPLYKNDAAADDDGSGELSQAGSSFRAC